MGVLVVLAGTSVVLRVSGLTQLALTVVGGTGLVGLALGIAFRDITENFLVSVFLSMQRPFETGDAGRQPRSDPECHRLQEQPAQLHKQ